MTRADSSPETPRLDTPEPSPAADRAVEDALARAILALAAARGPDKTICPSEAARAVGGDHPDGWGPLMTPLRRVAVRLAEEGRIVISRKGRIVDPRAFKGVYRLGLPRCD